MISIALGHQPLDFQAFQADAHPIVRYLAEVVNTILLLISNFFDRKSGEAMPPRVQTVT